MRGRRVNIALLGVGKIGRFHAETLTRHAPDARLAAVVDPAPENAEEAAAFGEDVFVAADPAVVLRNEGIDAVVIATPSASHAAMIIAAANSGKHVYCEKPLALTIDDGKRALAAVESAGVKLQIGFQRRFDAGYVRARAAIARGDLGAIEILISTTRDPTPPAPGYLESCGGIFLETAIHDFDSVRFLSGSEVVEVYATASTLVTTDRHSPYDIDTTCAVLRLASGALATVTNSLRAVYGYEAAAEVFGSRGKTVVSMGDKDGVATYGAGGVVTRYPRTYLERFGLAYRAEIIDFVRCVKQGDTPRVTGEDALRAVEVALAATRSQRDGRVVPL